MDNQRYVTYLPDGTLDGCYLQVPPEAHADRMIVIDEELAGVWVNYRANEARDGLELVPMLPPVVDLSALRTAAVTRTYVDVDAVTADAVGNRVEEYRDAEAAARAYAAAGYQGDVDLSVSSYAQYNPTGEVQTSQWAADQIIARADAFRAAQKEMRAKRFESQAAIRAAATKDELDAALAVWDQFMADIRSALVL